MLETFLIHFEMADYWKAKETAGNDRKSTSIDPDKMFDSRIPKRGETSSTLPQKVVTPPIDMGRLAVDQKAIDRLLAGINNKQRRFPQPRGFHDPNPFYGNGNDKAF